MTNKISETIDILYEKAQSYQRIITRGTEAFRPIRDKKETQAKTEAEQQLKQYFRSEMLKLAKDKPTALKQDGIIWVDYGELEQAIEKWEG